MEFVELSVPLISMASILQHIYVHTVVIKKNLRNYNYVTLFYSTGADCANIYRAMHGKSHGSPCCEVVLLPCWSLVGAVIVAIVSATTIETM